MMNSGSVPADTLVRARCSTSERLSDRIFKLVDLINQAGGWGSVTMVIEKGRVARIVWSVDEKVNDLSR